MKINSIILNVLFIIILICLIYFFIYLNNSNFENFANTDPVDIPTEETIVSSEVDLIEEVKTNNGLTFDKPLKNANFGYILEAVADNNEYKPKYIDGYYWVNIQNMGSQYIYCIMDKKYFGGGWMLAMRSVIGSKNFSYNSTYFKEPSILNNDSKFIANEVIKDLKSDDFSISSIGGQIYSKNLDPMKYDAKFHTFNYTNASEWMAIFYVKDNNGNIITGGDYVKNTRGWVWYEKDVKIQATDNFNKRFNKIVSPLDLFKFLDDNKISRKISSKFAQNMSGKFTNAKVRRGKNPLENTNIIFSSQPISEDNTSFYGINYSNSNRPVSNIRWGFSFNDSEDSSNDAFSGIGTSYVDMSNVNGSQNKNAYSAGNFEMTDNPTTEFLDRPQRELRNASYAVEWYVREPGVNCSV